MLHHQQGFQDTVLENVCNESCTDALSFIHPAENFQCLLHQALFWELGTQRPGGLHSSGGAEVNKIISGVITSEKRKAGWGIGDASNTNSDKTTEKGFSEEVSSDEEPEWSQRNMKCWLQAEREQLVRRFQGSDQRKPRVLDHRELGRDAGTHATFLTMGWALDLIKYDGDDFDKGEIQSDPTDCVKCKVKGSKSESLRHLGAPEGENDGMN